MSDPVTDTIIDPNAPIQMKMKRKYLVKKPGNKGTSKRNNSGPSGKRMRRGLNVVSVNTSVAQYGMWRSWMEKSGMKVCG